jgi:hypothetical protein
MSVKTQGQQDRVCCRACAETGVPELGWFIPFGDLMVPSSSVPPRSYSRIRDDGMTERRHDDGSRGRRYATGRVPFGWKDRPGRRRVWIVVSFIMLGIWESQHNNYWVLAFR